MARWKLTEDHYLNGCPPDLDACEWEYKETDRTNGRERRKRFVVPFYAVADSIVCYAGKGQPSDIVFTGAPTPSMEPLDDEARTISKEWEPRWQHPIESLPGQGFSASLLSGLERQLAELSAKTPAPVVQSGVSKEEFDALKEQLALLLAEKAEREATKSAEVKPSGVGPIKRKVA